MDDLGDRDMIFEIAISPAGRLFLNQTQIVIESPEQSDEVTEAFESSSAHGLLYLVTDCLTAELSVSAAFWRDFARVYLQQLCHTSLADSESAPILEVARNDLVQLVEQAPPMRGSEFFDVQLLEKLWAEFGMLVTRESESAGAAAWLKSLNPLWHTVGRVTFHLAENKQSPERPFAFLATYTHRLSERGKPQHLPLARALQEYSGTKNKAALAALLVPVQRAAEKSVLIRELLESRRLFQPLAWFPQDAYRFLNQIPVLEESGLLVRVPDWWKSRRPPRPQVKVTIGENKTRTMSLEGMLDFSVEMALDGEKLTAAERRQLMAAKEGLVLLKGKWVEVDQERLGQVLEHWRKIEKTGGEISFLEGMRLLSGISGTTQEDPTIQTEARLWSEVVPGEWLKGMLSAMRDPSQIQGFDPGKDLKAELRNYQAEGVRWLWWMSKLGLGACLADDMGLGKTIQTIALLLQLRRETNQKTRQVPSLLVAPASLLANWKQELARFAPTLSFMIVHPSEMSDGHLKELAEKGGQQGLGNVDLVITTYGMLLRSVFFEKNQWRLVVLDEAQAIKNPSSRQTVSVKKLKAQSRIALTGTPIENRLGDLWSLFDFICPGLLGSATEFNRIVKRLSDDQTHHFGPLRDLTKPYILRRLKTNKQIISDLPDKTEMAAWCALSKAQAALYEQSVDELGKRLETATGIQRRGIVLAFIMRFKQICNHPSHWLGDSQFDLAGSGKFLRLSEIGEEIAERQEKVLIFTQFKEMTQPLAVSLQKIFGKPGLILHGGTAVKERQRLVEEFQRDGGPPFFVLSLKAGGTGLNLTAASHVIHFDRWWNPAVENQATDRAFRIGQKKNVLVHQFVCRGTLEEKIHHLIEEKKGLASEWLEGGEEKLLTEMPDDELLRFVALDLKSVEDGVPLPQWR
jgi:superfamily II DNA or RNA helicase